MKEDKLQIAIIGCGGMDGTTKDKESLQKVYLETLSEAESANKPNARY